MQVLCHDEKGLNLFCAVLETLTVELVLNDEYYLLTRLAQGEVTGDHFFHDYKSLELKLLA